MTYRVVLRADASTAIGTGHVMRCLTLAEEMIARGWSVKLLAAELPEALGERARNAGLLVERIAVRAGTQADADVTSAAAAVSDLVVLDSYAFASAYRGQVRDVGTPVLTMDDGSTSHALHADFVLNPAVAAEPGQYTEWAPGARLLLGPRYALVRREIRDAAARAISDAAERTRLIVLFGGSDPRRLTIPVATLLQQRLPNAHVTAIVGSAARSVETPPSVELLRAPANLPSLMGEAGLAVSAAGGSLGELAHLGVPTVAAVIAENQVSAHALRGWLIAVDARDGDVTQRLVDEAVSLWERPSERRQMGRAGRDQVDGQGVVRVVDALCAPSACGGR
jgi:UDP-2,4-diacetamido-2,4,6-trideoxy-beta-L-altropyranose hydrolase